MDFVTRYFSTLKIVEKPNNEVAEFFFQGDITTSTNAIALGSIFALLLAYIDFLFFKTSQMFYLLLGMRVIFLTYSILLIRSINRNRDSIRPSNLEIKILIWFLTLSFLLLSVDYGRPSSYIQNQAIYVLIIFSFYTVVQIPLRSRLIPALLLTVADLLILFLIKDPMTVQSINMIVAIQLITHVLGIQTANQTIAYRTEQFSLFQQKENALKEMDQLAKHDGLTGLINRRHFFELLNKEYQRFMRLREPFCILILDIDDFKKINDKYGHAAGDEVLRKISKALLENARTMDVVSRVGGEEFAILCPGLGVKDAFSIGERTRIICENVKVKVDKKLVSVTTSIGITEVHQSDNDIEGIMRRADVALYSAKSNGKNQVVMSEFNLKPKSGNESYQLFGG